jgi:protein subunit release factor B
MNKEFEARLAALGMRSSDVEERFILGSGKGGQKIQKTSSCVWLKHRPTGVEARCQRGRSQVANRELAWTELTEKLEKQKRALEASREDERQRNRRRNRPKSRGQKVRMIQAKRHRTGLKSKRGRVGSE